VARLGDDCGSATCAAPGNGVDTTAARRALSSPAPDVNPRDAWPIQRSRRRIVPATALEVPVDPRPIGRIALRFTPAEWRRLLEDAAFLRDRDNSYAPRRLMGLPVEIVPVHRFG
jgi:hypothetical protein